MIERKLQLHLREVFERETKSQTVFLQVRDGAGRELEWLGEQFRPRRISKKLDPQQQERIRQLNELWSQSIKGKVREFKKKLKDHKSIPRQDLGFIVTHQSLNKTFA